MRYARILAGLFIAGMLLVGCGGATGDSSSTTAADEGRLITGEILTTDVTAASKALGDSSGCIGEVCGIEARGSGGEHVEGEIEPATNRWRIRVRAGNWMFGFLDGAGNRLGYLVMNGLTSVTVEDGEEIDLGPMRLRNGEMIMERDREGLGEEGVFSTCHLDRNRNGIPDDAEDEAAVYDPEQFEIVQVRPFDAMLDVAPCRPVAVSFNMPLNEESITMDTILVQLGDETPVAGTFEYLQHEDCAIYTALFMPDESFPLGETISVTVASGPDGVLSAEGDELLEDVAFSFTIRDFGDPLCTCFDPDLERHRHRIRCEGCTPPCEGCPPPGEEDDVEDDS